MSECEDQQTTDDSRILEAYHKALLDGTSLELAEDQSASLGGALRCIRALERNRQFEQGVDRPRPADAQHESATEFHQQIGRFEIIRKLGQGGSGIVFLAKDPALDREIALKVPTPEALLNAEFVKRFEREGRLAANSNTRTSSVFSSRVLSGPLATSHPATATVRR